MKSFYACYLWLTTKAPDWLTDACAYHHHICYSLPYQALKTTLNCVRTLYRKYFEYKVLSNSYFDDISVANSVVHTGDADVEMSGDGGGKINQDGSREKMITGNTSI